MIPTFGSSLLPLCQMSLSLLFLSLCGHTPSLPVYQVRRGRTPTENLLQIVSFNLVLSKWGLTFNLICNDGDRWWIALLLQTFLGRGYANKRRMKLFCGWSELQRRATMKMDSNLRVQVHTVRTAEANPYLLASSSTRNPLRGFKVSVKIWNVRNVVCIHDLDSWSRMHALAGISPGHVLSKLQNTFAELYGWVGSNYDEFVSLQGTSSA